MAKNEDALRKKVDDAREKLADAREKHAAKPTAATDKSLAKARVEASEALRALWDAVPNEKPPTQHVM